MIVRKFLLAAACAATLITGNLASVAPASANDAAVAGAAGLVGGMILGGALAQGARPEPIEEEVVVRRRHRPVRVYEEEVVQPRRCWREEYQDRWGDIHYRRVCR
ncbi:MAG: hypothetical protein ABTQ29_05955 [Siculibacillus sp.]